MHTLKYASTKRIPRTKAGSGVVTVMVRVTLCVCACEFGFVCVCHKSTISFVEEEQMIRCKIKNENDVCVTMCVITPPSVRPKQ